MEEQKECSFLPFTFPSPFFHKNTLFSSTVWKMTIYFNSSVGSSTCRSKHFLPGRIMTILIFSSDTFHCNPNKHIQVYDEERSYQTNGSKVTSSSWWPSESLFSRAAWWGEYSSDVIHWNRNSKYSPFLNNVILPWQHIITGFLLFISQVRKERWTIYHSWILDLNADISWNSISIEYIFWVLYAHTYAAALKHKG